MQYMYINKSNKLNYRLRLNIIKVMVKLKDGLDHIKWNFQEGIMKKELVV